MKVLKTAFDFDINKKSKFTLLGSWCLKNNSNILKEIDSYEIVPYHWDDKKKFREDYEYLTNLYEKKLKQCTEILNEIHSTKKNIRYWRIIIGPWLRFFIDSLFDRYECINYANKHVNEITYDIHRYNQDISASDFPEFYNNLTLDAWNEIIFSECIKFLKINNATTDSNILIDNISINQETLLKKLIKRIVWIYQSFLAKSIKKITIISPYISLRKLIKLHISLKTMPYISAPEIKCKYKSINLKKRELFKFNKSEDQFELFLNNQIKKNIPKIYIESYNYFKSYALKELPKKTNLIYTANAYQSNEAFKFWSAEMVSNDSKLIIGQHGGTFGLSLFNQTEKHQIKISDKFLSWGWELKINKNVRPMPAIQLNGSNLISEMFNGDGKILHVLGCLPRYFYNYFSMPIAGQYIDYLKDQTLFLKNLDQNVINNLQIRTDASSKKWGWDEKEIIKNNGFIENISKSEVSFMKQLSNSSLCVCTHNGTVPLECLALNFPTIIFWNSEHYELREDAKKYLKKLREVKIFFDSPIDAANHINDIKNNISYWWNQYDVQEARSSFIEKYALSKKDSIIIMKDFLNNEASII